MGETIGNFTLDNDTLMRYTGHDSGVVLPSAVTAIAPHAFENCTSLRHVTFPAGIEAIGTEAFLEIGRAHV